MGLRSIKMPDVGEGVAEAEIVEWHVKVGDPCRRISSVAAVMTDKATVEIPTPVAGTVVALGGAVGDVLAVGSELIRIDAPGLPDSPAAPPAKGAAKAPRPEPARPAAPPPRSVANITAEAAPAPPVAEAEAEPPLARVAKPSRSPASPQLHPPPRGAPRAAGEKPLASPAVRLRAREAGVDLRFVHGSGPAGRITHDDLDAYHRPSARRAGERAGAAAEHGGRDDQDRRHAPPHRPEHGGVVAPGRAFLLCRGGRRHRARGAARGAERAGDGGAPEADGAAVPDARDRQGGRRLSRGQRPLRRRQRPSDHLRRRASRHRDPDAGRADGSGRAPRRDASALTRPRAKCAG